MALFMLEIWSGKGWQSPREHNSLASPFFSVCQGSISIHIFLCSLWMILHCWDLSPSFIFNKERRRPMSNLCCNHVTPNMAYYTSTCKVVLEVMVQIMSLYSHGLVCRRPGVDTMSWPCSGNTTQLSVYWVVFSRHKMDKSCLQEGCTIWTCAIKKQMFIFCCIMFFYGVP